MNGGFDFLPIEAAMIATDQIPALARPPAPGVWRLNPQIHAAIRGKSHRHAFRNDVRTMRG